MENYIYPILRYFFGNHNTDKEELSDIEKSIDSPNYRDKYFDYNQYNENINNNYNNKNTNSNNNDNDNAYENIRNIRDDYGNDFVIMI
tara:strand:+ start:10 stop:273 length:264 start_codon:yes stop_codon:yes gene_type:complete